MNKELIEEIEKIANLYNIFIIKDKNGKFTKEFIEKFQDKVNWEDISINQELSEEFMEGFQDKIDWEGISYGQKLSENFIEKK
jgi:hypothetical protein